MLPNNKKAPPPAQAKSSKGLSNKPASQPKLRTEDLPIFLHDRNKKLIAGIKIEKLQVSDAGLLIAGWTIGFSRLSLMCDNERLPTEMQRVPRMDVLQTLAVSSDFDPGFELTLTDVKQGNYTLRWFLERNKKVEPVDFLIDVGMPDTQGSLEETSLEQLFGFDVAQSGKTAIKDGREIECAIRINDGVVLIGWLDDREGQSTTLHIQKSRGSHDQYELSGTRASKEVARVYRQDVCKLLGAPRGEYPALGLVAWLPFNTVGLDSLTISFDKSFKKALTIPVSMPDNNDSELDTLLEHSGYALLGIAERHNEDDLISWLENRGYTSQATGTSPVAAIDHAYLIGGRALLLHGWPASKTRDLKSISLVSGQITFPLEVQRLQRPDLFDAYPVLNGESLGFVCLVTGPEFVSLASKKLKIRTATGRASLTFTPEPIDLSGVFGLMSSVPGLLEPVKNLITQSAAMQSIPGLCERLNQFLHNNFINQFNSMSVSVHNEKAAIAAIDKVYALDDCGLLIFGWHFEPEKKPLRVTVHDPDGNQVDVTQRLFPLFRPDVAQNLRGNYPAVKDMCGFVCHAVLPSKAGEPRALRFLFEENNEVWLKLVTGKPTLDSLQLIREVLGFVPSPDRIRTELYQLFDIALGRPIERIHQTRKLPELGTSEVQFGVAPKDPAISVIIPLYGRYDFMRHQLAHFVSDPDFDTADLIYVVDDPAIIEQTLQSAAYCHELFGKPFRVLSYKANLGFAGANNMGVRHATAEILLLLNSDVLPQQAGWLTVLHKALLKQPKAGAVGPLLEFGDGSIQHAGMQPRRDPKFPGFVLNSHGSKGLNWTKGEQPVKVPMLTAACIMLRKADYLAAGGLDEGYIIGDFEDSDLCLKLVKDGKLMWLVPAAKLWHLERQSQNLNNVAGVRQLLTLFNGWRFHQKILTGAIANPEVSE